MTRRKLFSATPRRRLFGDIAGNGANPLPIPTEIKPKEHTTGRILVCHDCGFQEEDPGTGSTREYCPQCGSSRFEYLETMPAYGHPGSIGCSCAAGEEVEKEFSMAYRKVRRSLFSALTHRQPNNTGEGTDNGATPESVFKCTDCGHEFALKCDTVSGTRCPGCGGNRVVKVSTDSYSDHDTTVEFLKEVSGKTFSQEDAQKLFSEHGAQGTLQDLVDSGYAHLNEASEVCFSEGVDQEYSLFSKLVITVTRELDLDPISEGRKEELIHSLEGGSIPPKGILLIKKAHGLVPHASDLEAPQGPIGEDYLKDSGIITDLGLEHGGETIGLPKFMEIIRKRYNDAPDNLLDLLTSKGIVKISGSQVAIS